MGGNSIFKVRFLLKLNLNCCAMDRYKYSMKAPRSHHSGLKKDTLRAAKGSHMLSLASRRPEENPAYVYQPSLASRLKSPDLYQGVPVSRTYAPARPTYKTLSKSRKAAETFNGQKAFGT